MYVDVGMIIYFGEGKVYYMKMIEEINMLMQNGIFDFMDLSRDIGNREMECVLDFCKNLNYLDNIVIKNYDVKANYSEVICNFKEGGFELVSRECGNIEFCKDKYGKYIVGRFLSKLEKGCVYDNIVDDVRCWKINHGMKDGSFGKMANRIDAVMQDVVFNFLSLSSDIGNREMECVLDFCKHLHAIHIIVSDYRVKLDHRETINNLNKAGFEVVREDFDFNLDNAFYEKKYAEYIVGNFLCQLEKRCTNNDIFIGVESWKSLHGKENGVIRKMMEGRGVDYKLFQIGLCKIGDPAVQELKNILSDLVRE